MNGQVVAECASLAYSSTRFGYRGRLQRQPDFARHIARLAVRSLYAELTLYPKPGLVSLADNGSHTDMSAVSFMRSLFSLRHYFFNITQAGADDAPFERLKDLGLAAERRMLAATGGVNTHRGAIFCLGLLCAAIGYCRAQHVPLTATAIRHALLARWGAALAQHQPARPSLAHGAQVAARHALGGAREEAALGLPSVFALALPCFERTLAQGRGWECAAVDALFLLMAQISDTNVVYRGGLAGAALVKTRAVHFLAAGGSAHPAWRQTALDCHRLFVAHQLSPGGAADLLAATCLLVQVTQYPGTSAFLTRAS
jgi:triphosphoribosyl-dephospho-CoA synthase